jgi:hypothetical protein
MQFSRARSFMDDPRLLRSDRSLNANMFGRIFGNRIKKSVDGIKTTTDSVLVVLEDMSCRLK